MLKSEYSTVLVFLTDCRHCRIREFQEIIHDGCSVACHHNGTDTGACAELSYHSGLVPMAFSAPQAVCPGESLRGRVQEPDVENYGLGFSRT